MSAVVERVDELRALLEPHRAAGARIGFVPTMGALHDGHAELIRVARRECDVVVTSCFVNPTQFGPGEDLDRYPRTPERDEEIAAGAGTDVLWRPDTHDVYGPDPGEAVSVHVGRLGTILEGRVRPGHFDGVATVVVRLLGVVAPQVLYLGAKDFQQVVVLRRVVADLLVPVSVRTVATVREPDGLARSSRNAYLSDDDRRAALVLPAALGSVAALVASGTTRSSELLEVARRELRGATGIEVDYAELVDAGTLEPIAAVGGERDAVLLAAIRVGTTRLIDNLPLPAAISTTPGEARP